MVTYYDLTTNLFLQLAIIISVCRLVVYIGKRFFYQTEVVSEMLAGFILGPSIFGLFAPKLQQAIFPSAKQILIDGSSMPNISMTLLFAISQIGIVLYMFITGMQFSTKKIRSSAKSILFLSIAGMLIPFLSGAVFISSIDTSSLIGEGISTTVAMIYFGCVISITAFPVLVQIMDEKKISKTSLGSLVLTTGSLQDAAAWALVALILTLIHHSALIIIIMIVGTIVYILLMIGLGRFLQTKFSNHFHRDLAPSKQSLSFILIILLLCAVTVDKIGLYSAFGAFVAGAVMPKGYFSQQLREKFAFLTKSLMLPVFFTFSGLNTEIALINTPALWLITGAIILLAVASKIITCTLAARITGMPWRESSAYGVLMNTRGLIELVILNIGLQHHIISLTLFTMGVIMTLTTTLITSPLISFILRKPPK